MGKKRSIFYNYLYDSLRFYSVASMIYEKIKNLNEPVLPDLKAQEEMKLFHIARSYEALSKAFLVSYGFLVIYPSLVISVAKKKVERSPRHLEKELNSLSILVRQALNPRKIAEKLRHDPLGRSHLPSLLRSTAKFEQQIGESELASFTNKVADFLSKKPNERRYSDLIALRRELVKVIQFREMYNRLFEILKKCLQSNANDDICKDLTEEDREILASLADKPYLLDQIITMLDLGFQELYDAIMYTAYLARAAEIADYNIGRTEEDEKYLAEVLDHQQEIFNFLIKIQQTNAKLIKDDELDEFMSQIEEQARESFKKLDQSKRNEQHSSRNK